MLSELIEGTIFFLRCDFKSFDRRWWNFRDMSINVYKFHLLNFKSLCPFFDVMCEIFTLEYFLQCRKLTDLQEITAIIAH
jgi:hypothetical protein